MGLDQYAYTRKPKSKEQQEIAYWRKHNALQGWMEKLWRDKEGQGEFNCVEVILTHEDLRELENDLVVNNLPETNGFFFGSDSRLDEYKMIETFKFIIKARRALDDGLEVIYSSWW
jgi:hypothetical protein